ncbi:MAG: PrsW family glutamic-type intramembrane protease [Leucobacter sp.]
MTEPETAARAGVGSAARIAWQPAQPAFWVMLVCLLCCAPLQLLAFADQGLSVETVGFVALVGASQLAIFWLLARALSRGRSRPIALRLLALAWGFAVVPVIALLANSHYFGALNSLGLRSLAASIAAPLDEDLLRLVGVLGVLILAARDRISAVDGVVYGLLVGAGFEVAENLIYVLDAEGLDSAMRIALIRFGIGFGLHALWTGIAGAALSACLGRRQRGGRGGWWLILPGIGVPMLLHALWDAPALSVDPRAKVAVLVAVYAVTLACFIATVVLARRSERSCRVSGAAAG